MMPEDISGTDETPGVCAIMFYRRKEVVVFKVGGEHFAVDNLCPHRKAPLSAGEVSGHIVTCPWHGARFDLRTGKGLKGSHRADIGCYTVTVEGAAFRLEEKR